MQRQPTLPAVDQVFAKGVDCFEHPSIQMRGTRRESTLRRTSADGSTSKSVALPAGDPMDGMAFGHRSTVHTAATTRDG